MPTPSRSGDLNSRTASSGASRLFSSTFSPRPRRARSEILPRSSEIDSLIASGLEAFDGEGGVVATEAEAVAEYGRYVPFDAGIRSVVEIELGVRVLIVDRRRDHSIPHDQGADHGFDGTSGAQHVTSRGLGRADIHVLRVVAEDGLDGARFVEVVRRRR